MISCILIKDKVKYWNRESIADPDLLLRIRSMTNDRGQNENFRGQTHLDVKSNHHGFTNPAFLSSDNTNQKKAERAMSPTLSIASLTTVISNQNLRQSFVNPLVIWAHGIFGQLRKLSKGHMQRTEFVHCHDYQIMIQKKNHQLHRITQNTWGRKILNERLGKVR